MKFIIWVIDSESGTADNNEMAAIDSFNESLRRSGNWIMAAGVAAPSEALLIDNRNNLGEVQAGSLFDAPDYYSGFWIIESANKDAAIEIAKSGSAACNRRVELRPFLGQ